MHSINNNYTVLEHVTKYQKRVWMRKYCNAILTRKLRN